MSDLKEGGLALIINAKNPENIGVIVDIIRFVSKGDPLPEICGDSLASITGWLVTGAIRNVGGHIGVGVSYEKDLMPINPEQDPLEITEKEQEYAR